MKKIYMSCLLILMSALLLGQARVVSAGDIPVALEPETVQMGTFYNGTTVTVSGRIPADAEAVVRISGSTEDLHLKKKGKVAGVLWMNTNDLTFHNAPTVYLVQTSGGLSDLDNSAARDFGFSALKDRVEISPASDENDFLLKEFIRLKEQDNLYAVTPGGVTFGNIQDGMKSYQATLTIPSAMKQGSYSVEVAAVQGGSLIGKTDKSLVLKQVGLPAKISDMAFGSELSYGSMAVIIAVMAGLIMGTLFKDKGGSH